MEFDIHETTDYGHPVRKSPSLHSRKSNPNPKFIGTAEAYFTCHFSFGAFLDLFPPESLKNFILDV